MAFYQQIGALAVAGGAGNTRRSESRSGKASWVLHFGGLAKAGAQILLEEWGGAVEAINQSGMNAGELGEGASLTGAGITLNGHSLDPNHLAYQVAAAGGSIGWSEQTDVPLASVSSAETKYALQHYVVEPALTDTNRARLNLGVGEEVNLTGMPENTIWKTTAGSINGEGFFIAPSNAANATVTATVGGKSLQVTFKVKEPSGIDHAKIIGTYNYPLNTAGAGMTNIVWIAPTYVSFYRVNVMEVGENATNIWGFFADTNFFTANPAHQLRHSTADHWTHLQVDNSLIDNAAFGGYLPWAAGGFEWNIPQRWQVDGSGVTNSMAGCNQVFSISSNGVAKVTKYGNWVQRTTNNVITTN